MMIPRKSFSDLMSYVMILTNLKSTLKKLKVGTTNKTQNSSTTVRNFYQISTPVHRVLVVTTVVITQY